MLSVLHLEDRLLGQLAPGNPARFLRLLNDADQRLLEAGKWRWTRSALTLVVTDNEVVLPITHEAIVAARVGDVAKDVKWQEGEYWEAGPGFVPLEAITTIVDQGMREIANGVATVIADNLDELTLTAAGTSNGESFYTSNGLSPAPATGTWYKLDYFADGADDYWRLTKTVDNVLTDLTWTLPITVTDVEEPTEWTYSDGVAEPVEVAMRVVLGFDERRVYKVTGTGTIDDLQVLARYKPKELSALADTPRCQCFAALKQAMYAVMFEEANDLERSQGFFALAVQSLDRQEASYRGSARQILKPRLFGHKLRRRPTNFP